MIYEPSSGHPQNGFAYLDFTFGQRSPACPTNPPAVSVSGPTLVPTGSLCEWQAGAAHAQERQRGTGQAEALGTGEGTGSLGGRVRPTVSAGISRTIFDAGGDATFTGLGLRLGARMHRLLDITAGVQHWPTFGPYTAWAYQIEGAFYPIGRQRASPYLLLALGYFAADHENPAWSDLRGRAEAVALGLKLPSGQGLGSP